MTQHTPGPWTDRIGRIYARGEWHLLCGCRIVSGKETSNDGVCRDEVWVGQCPTHAAAPEMATKLRQIADGDPDIQRFAEFGPERQLQDALLYIAAVKQGARALLAKIEGGQP